MHAYETRASQVFRIVEGGADSREDLKKSEPIMLLSEAQLEVCWARIAANRKAAIRVAGRFVSKERAEDVVHTAALRFVENAQQSTNPEPFPANKDQFRRKFLKAVRNHAYDCVRDSKRPACPVHSHWGIDPEPELRGHNLADRALDTLFARNDHGKYDAPAPTVRRDKDDLNGLHDILRNHMEDLSPTEREIVEETYFQEQPRDEIAARRGISLNTYDNHRKAACRKLRDSMMAVIDFSTDIDLPDWYDRIEEMNKRHSARQRRRASRKKENRSSSGGDRSKFEGDRSNSRGDREKNERARDEPIAVATES
jgi:RNA polymerase sigma factor (sigma-70 family)